MPREPRPSDEASSVGSDGPQPPNLAAEGGESSPARVIPGNVGSLDDVPAEWVENGTPIVEEEGT